MKNVEKIGIVLEKITEERIMGYLATLKVDVELDENLAIRVKKEINKTRFILNTKKKVYGITAGCYDTALEIGRQLKEIGFRDLSLCFNDRTIKI